MERLGIIASTSRWRELAAHFTVYNFDRRGRGRSGDTHPYAVEREIEDVAALFTELANRRSCTATLPARRLRCARPRRA